MLSVLISSRTHRERKEHYIKALEHEVLRLKELYGNSTRDRDAHASENRKLRELLASHGIHYDFSTPNASFNSAYDGASSGSISGSYRQDTASNGLSPSPLHSSHANRTPTHAHAPSAALIPSGGLDYDQMGIDFVLTYDSSGRPIRPAYPSPPPGQ